MQNHRSYAYSGHKKPASVSTMRQTIQEGTRVLWKESGHRLRTTVYLAESFDEPCGKRAFDTFTYFFSLIRIFEFSFANFSSTCVYGVRISSKERAAQEADILKKDRPSKIKSSRIEPRYSHEDVIPVKNLRQGLIGSEHLVESVVIDVGHKHLQNWIPVKWRTFPRSGGIPDKKPEPAEKLDQVGDGNVRNQEKTVSLFLTSLQLCLFLSWLKFLPFLPKFYCFVVSNYWRVTVIISQNDAHVLTTT